MKAPKLLVTTPWSFQEGLIQAYTLPYLRMILKINPEAEIYLLTEEKPSLSFDESSLRSTAEKLRNERIYWLPKRYHRFGMRAIIFQGFWLLRLWWLILSKGITHLHAFTTPGGVTAYILSIFTGKKLIIDSFEPHAEAQVENGTWTRKSLGFKILWWFEKRMARRADHLIYTSRNMIDYGIRKYQAHDPAEFVKPACVDASMFTTKGEEVERLREELHLTNAIVGVYAGKLGGIYHDVAFFQFAKAAAAFFDRPFRMLLLNNDPEEMIQSYLKQAHCPPEIIVRRFVPHDQIPAHLQLADFGITFVKSVPTKKCCTPIKDGEYWACGLPVVITPDIGDDSAIIASERIGVVIDDFSEVAINRSLKELKQLIDPVENGTLKERIQRIADRERNFRRAELIYKQLYLD